MKRFISAFVAAIAASTLVGCACTTCSGGKACCGDGTGACCTEEHDHDHDQGDGNGESEAAALRHDHERGEGPAAG